MKKNWIIIISTIICLTFLVFSYTQKLQADLNIEKAIISQKMAVEMEQKVKSLEADLIECQLIAEQSAEMAKIAEAKAMHAMQEAGKSK